MAGTNAKKNEIGPRITVAVGQVKKKVGTKTVNVTVYSYMSKKTADYFGFVAAKSAVSTSSSGKGGKKATPRIVRGSKGGAIKVPTAEKSTNGATKYKQIPMPSGLPLTQIQAFLAKAKTNKPTSFVSSGGRTYPVQSSKSGGKK